MAIASAAARKKVSKLAGKVEQLIHQLWDLEARLTAAAASGNLPEAEELAARIACVCVDYLHRAVDSLRELAQPKRRTGPESSDEPPLRPQGEAER